MSYLQKQNIKREIAKKLDIIEQIIPLNSNSKSDLKEKPPTMLNNETMD
jgi:hypothetical protein